MLPYTVFPIPSPLTHIAMKPSLTTGALILLTALLTASTTPQAQGQARLPSAGSTHVIFTEPGSGGNLPIIVGNGDGFVEYANPDTDPCPDAGDPGCDLGLGNTVYNDPNVTEDYYFSSTATGDVTRLYRYIESLNGDHIAIRWTQSGGYGLSFPANATGTPVDPNTLQVIRVPFELWGVGPSLGDTSDDVRMIPLLLLDVGADGTAGTADDDSTQVTDWTAVYPFVGFAEDGSGLPATNAIYMMMPDRADGYDLFEQAALDAGGAGATYVDTDDTVTPIDPDHLDIGDVSAASGEDCGHQGGYISWCYRNDQYSGDPAAPNLYGSYFGIGDPLLDPNLLFAYPIGRVQVVDLASVVAVEPSDPDQPEGTALLAPYPNPMSGRAAVPYVLRTPAHVRLAVYDVLGREVAVLADAERPAGAYTATLDGAGLAAGLYTVRLEVNGTLTGVQKVAIQR